MPLELVSGVASLLELQMLDLHMAFPLWEHRERGRETEIGPSGVSSSSSKDTPPIGLGPNTYDLI